MMLAEAMAAKRLSDQARIAAVLDAGGHPRFPALRNFSGPVRASALRLIASTSAS
jgi:hypothetical protein